MKIAYIGEWHPTNGTYYRQRITVSKEEYKKINLALSGIFENAISDTKKAGVITYDQMETLLYRKPLDASERIGNKIYIKLKQLYVIMRLFPEEKRITGNNTILYIK